MTAASLADADLCRALNLIQRSWAFQSEKFIQRVERGRSIERFPDVSESAAQRSAQAAASELAILEGIDLKKLPHQIALTLKLAQFQLKIECQRARRYWLAQTYSWVPTMFPVAPYGTTHLFQSVARTFRDFRFVDRGDCSRYLALLEDFARLLDQIREMLLEQARRGIRIPQPALPNVRGLLEHHASTSAEALAIGPIRLTNALGSGGFADTVARRINERVIPAFARLRAALDEDYAARAPETVGMGQFPGGIETYESLVAEQVSLPVTIDEVHRTGRERLTELEARMSELRAAVGHPDREDFHNHLRTAPPWAVASEAEIQRYFERALERIRPHIDGLFRVHPTAPYRTERLNPALERGMTAGYYEPPNAARPDGVYYFNAPNLSRQSLAGAASLIYHELIPGHHFHLATQQENEQLHPFRRALLFNAFNEGWAEYAATLAGESGMYADPCEQYGRLLKDAYYTCRLVVDTGMNALNWSLEDARQYFRDHTNLSEPEVQSETLRYSTDIPAQSLAYKLGEMKMRELRKRAKRSLGRRFDIRDFHDVVLGSGGMPLEVLDWHVNSWISAARQ